MDHLIPFTPRPFETLPPVRQSGWVLKRIALIAEGRSLDPLALNAASRDTFDRLPDAGTLDQAGNHGVGFQIIHFAQTAVVVPTFYWEWGSVLARVPPVKATYTAPTQFNVENTRFIGCVWEMQIVAREVQLWTDTMLTGDPQINAYLTG